MVCHSLLQWTTFCQTSPPWPVRLGWSHMAWLNFFGLNKAVVRVIRLASFLWLWFQCVCPLMPSHNSTVLLGFLLPLSWCISSHCSSKAQPLLLTLDEVYLFTATPPDLERGIAPLGPPAPMQLLFLRRGIARLCCRPWPHTWGSSSWPILRCRSLALSVVTPYVGWGVAPLGHASARSFTAGVLMHGHMIY